MHRAAFRLTNLRHGYWIEHEFTRGETWEENTRALMRLERTRRLAAIEADEWPAAMGEDCQWCPILFRCSTVSDAAAQGADVIGDLAPAEIARRRAAMTALSGRYDRAAVALYERDGPIDLGDGSVLGGKPTGAWALVLPYEETLSTLRGWGMTPAQEIEWFRHCAAHHMASRVKSAMHELLGKGAKQAIEEGVLIEPVTKEQFGVWRPDVPIDTRDLSALDEWLTADDVAAEPVVPKDWGGESPF
jgi:hypothetical protein